MPSRGCAGRFDSDAVELHDAAEATGDDAVAACNALGLFGSGARLVVFENVEAWKAPDAKAIAEYLKSPAPGNDAGARRRRAEEGLADREGGRGRPATS